MRGHVSKLTFVGSFPGALPDLGLPEVAFAGRSNVGKSSALNCLLDRKAAARVSATPGRTQTINLFKIGEVGVFADLPGYGFAKVPDSVKEQWQGMIERYLSDRETLKLVVLLVDARREPQALDIDLHEALIGANVPTLVVATKVDKLNRRERDKSFADLRRAMDLPHEQPLAFSSVTREGRDKAWDRIEAACRGGAA